MTFPNRVFITLGIGCAWAILLILIEPALQSLMSAFAYSTAHGVRLFGLECMQNERSIFTPAYSTTISLLDLGLYWWGFLLLACLKPRSTPLRRSMILLGSIAACSLIHLIYEIALVIAGTSRFHAPLVAIQLAWYGALILAVYSMIVTILQCFVLEPSIGSTAPNLNSPNSGN